jgi:heat shock protein HslJ
MQNQHRRYAGATRTNLRLVLGALCLAAVPAWAQPALQDLSGTGWQLIEIASMDDSVTRPGDNGLYRLVFGADGSVSVTADCNRATGSLAAWDPPQLQFSPFATTLALCGPESLSERFLRELSWVRSYVYERGHLYLATMADGSIIEFEPLEPAAATATVGSLSLVVDSADDLRGIVLARLLEAYAAERGLTASNAEVSAYLAPKERRLRADLGEAYDDRSALPAQEQDLIARMEKNMAAAMIRSWKINRALHQDYGGRIIYQQLGPEPLDAYREFLEDAHDAGRFDIRSADLEEPFWSFFRDEKRHSFMPAGGEDEARAFATPPWEDGETP